MRLSVLDNGHRLRARLFFGMTKRMSRVDMSDVPKTLLYRPEFFGRSMLELSAVAMRGESFWTAGEREYLGMLIAGWHRCPYCAVSHTELVRIAGNGEIDAADPDSARPQLRAVITLLEKATRTPDRVTAADRPDGVPDAAIVEALHVHVVWNVVNRLANVFGFQLRPGQLESGTKALHRYGYRFPGFLTSGGNRPELPAELTDRHARLVEDLRASVLDAPATTDPALRRAVAAGDPISEPWMSYAAMVRDESYRVTDADVTRLRAAGHTEDEIFEVTVAGAVGAALTSLDAGLRALRRETVTPEPRGDSPGGSAPRG
jgi:AhpD family alkylhydroperoxidase